jgi:hypothetical protein
MRGPRLRIAVVVAVGAVAAPLATATAADVPIGIVLAPPVAIYNPSPEFIPAPLTPSPPTNGLVPPPAPLPPQVTIVSPVVPAVPGSRVLIAPPPVPARR